MKIFLANQIKAIDEFTIQNEPISSLNLMERAAAACSHWMINKFNAFQKFAVFAGNGNNGGDGLAIARLLAKSNVKVKVFILKIAPELKGDVLINYQRLIDQNNVSVEFIDNSEDLPFINEEEIIIDAIFGSGLTRPVDGFISHVIEHINSKLNVVVSIDIPSGLFGEDNSVLYEESFNKILRADYTLTLQQPNLSFFLSENNRFVGDFQIIPIGLHPKAMIDTHTKFNYLELKDIQAIVKERTKFSHKGTYGHGLLLAGSYGMMGACILAAKAAARSGIGLVTCHIPRMGVEIMQTAVPEALLSIDLSDIIVAELPKSEKYDALAFGPGIGTKENTCRTLKSVFENFKKPLVVDADGLNIMSKRCLLIDLIPENTIITPHPKEFDRLFGESKNAYERLMKQIEMSSKYHIYIILKGAHTSISCPDGTVYFNSTGNPGMATGGSGDVLTGIILSLLSQSYSQKEACLLAVYLHGLSGDLAKEEIGEEAIIASDLIDYLGKAFNFIHNNS